MLNGRGHYMHRGSPRRGRRQHLLRRPSSAGIAHCDAHVRTDLFGKHAQPRRPPRRFAGRVVHANGVPGNQGAYDPAYLQSAYNAPSATNGAGQTVAIVDAYDAPNAEADLAVYRSTFGLPPCTTANGCFRKVDENGGTAYPTPDAGWAQEIALDLDMVSALVPELQHPAGRGDATSRWRTSATAVNEAVALGADVVSNSYGGDEWSTEAQADARTSTTPVSRSSRAPATAATE